MFWSVKGNSTSLVNAWVISTMIHTYIAPNAAVVALSASKIKVSWPAWVEAVAATASPLIE